MTENDFRYELREYSQQHNLLRATVIVNIDYHDTAKGIELHHRDVPLYITCSVRPGHGFEIVAVDYENRD